MASEHAERKLAAILAADIAGYSRLAGADEERTLARLRALMSDLVDPAIAVHHGRIVKRMGDGILAEFRSVVDAARCAIEVQNGMVERNMGVPPDRCIEFRIGIHLGDVIEESDGDLMGDGVNIAARLQTIAEPGGICLSNAAYEQVRDRIAATFADLGERRLKNIARPVRVHALTRRAEILASVPAAEKPGPPRLSIVVLPFANIGGDLEQEYFVDGVTESLTTDLSRIGGSFVIARNTAFTYKGKPIDVKEIGRDLNVRYAIEASVQRGGGRMRVNVQIIDAESGNHLWAERFDKPVADLFDMQDEIIARLANQLGTVLVTAEARRAEKSLHPDSMDLYFRGLACMNQGWTPAFMAQARDYFERALASDAGNIDAAVAMAMVDVIVSGSLITDDRAARLAAAETALTRALSVAPNHALAHHVLGLVYVLTNRADQSIAEGERALALDRNLATAHALIGFAKRAAGRPEETERHVQDALRLSPRDKDAHLWMHVVALAKLALGADAEAIGWWRRSIEVNRNLSLAHFLLAAALALNGRIDEGKEAARAGLALDPAFTLRRYRAGAFGDHPTYVAVRERLCNGLRLAGVPEV